MEPTTKQLLEKKEQQIAEANALYKSGEITLAVLTVVLELLEMNYQGLEMTTEEKA